MRSGSRAPRSRTRPRSRWGLVAAIVAGVHFDPQREELWRVASTRCGRAARGYRRRHVPARLAPAAARPRAGGRRAQRLPRDPGGGRPARPGAARRRARGARRGRGLDPARAARPPRRHRPTRVPRPRRHRPGLGACRPWSSRRWAAAACSCSPGRVRRRRSSAPPAARARSRATAVGLAALVGLVGNTAVAQAEMPPPRSSWVDAETRARHAAWLAPWSAVALRLRGEAQYARATSRPPAEACAGPSRGTRSDPELWLALANSLRGNARARALAQAPGSTRSGSRLGGPGPPRRRPRACLAQRPIPTCTRRRDETRRAGPRRPSASGRRTAGCSPAAAAAGSPLGADGEHDRAVVVRAPSAGVVVTIGVERRNTSAPLAGRRELVSSTRTRTEKVPVLRYDSRRGVNCTDEISRRFGAHHVSIGTGPVPRVTAEVAADVAVDGPTAFRPVTATRSVEPTSTAWTTCRSGRWRRRSRRTRRRTRCSAATGT